jgi:CheY-like chemotaxis protein
VKPVRVLLVEDSPVHQRLLLAAFKEVPQVRVEAHADAESAWAALNGLIASPLAQWPDFALIDIGLPGASGIELVDRIRQSRHFEELPLLVLTASEDPEDQTESLLARADGFFRKPATASGYASLVKGILGFLGDGTAPKKAARRARTAVFKAGRTDQSS